MQHAGKAQGDFVCDACGINKQQQEGTVNRRLCHEGNAGTMLQECGHLPAAEAMKSVAYQFAEATLWYAPDYEELIQTQPSCPKGLAHLQLLQEPLSLTIGNNRFEWYTSPADRQAHIQMHNNVTKL